MLVRRVVAVLAALSLVGVAPAEAPARSDVAAVAAKHCPSGYPRARTPDGKIKCLHAGEFCKRAGSWQRVYRRHGFHCDSDHRLRER